MKKINKSLITKSLFITSTSLVFVPYFGSQLSISLNNQITTKDNLVQNNAISINNTHTHTHTQTDRHTTEERY